MGRRLGLIEQLELLLERLDTCRMPVFAVTPRESVDAHRLTRALMARGLGGAGIAALGPYLAPLLTRTGDERSAFETIVAGIEPVAQDAPPRTDSAPDRVIEPDEPEPSTWFDRLRERLPTSLPRSVAAVLLLGLLGLLAVAVGLGVGGITAQQTQQPAQAEDAAGGSGRPAATQTPTAMPSAPATAGDTDSWSALQDIVTRYDGAPTLREIARERAGSVPFRIEPDEYLRRLRALIAEPSDRPLAMRSSPWVLGRQAVDEDRLAWAIAQIETPGRQPRLADVLPSFTSSDWKDSAEVRRVTSSLAASDLIPPGGTNPAAQVVPQVRQRLVAIGGEPARWDDDHIARAVAAERPDWTPPDALWRPQASERATLPGWVPWPIALLTMMMLTGALLPFLDPRRGFLRLRPPRLPPHRTALVHEAADRPLGRAELLRDAHRALQRRMPRMTRAVDLRGSIRATIRDGGLPHVRAAVLQARPDYLVLMEQRGRTDLETQRALAMIAPLRTGAIGLDVYFFEGDPSFTRAERDGRRVTIQELMARYPNHRLLLIADGARMLDLFTGRLRGGYAMLGHWRRRGMLTPVPRTEWAREELLIARGIGGPLAQLSDSGVLTLARQLPQEVRDSGAPADPLDAPLGEVPPMPRDLARALLQVPEWIAQGNEAALDRLVADLSWYPDGPGFEWLCALAVYPAATYDLALYLGTQMRLQSAGSTGAALFTPARLAALTRLEWLRVGRIPDAIRRRLAARLSPERSREVRGLIQRLIEEADAQGAQPEASRAAYAREEASAGPPPERLYEDEVFVDFMRAGEVDELAVDLPEARPASWQKQLREIDWLRLGAVVMVWGYAIAAWLATPGRDERPDDPLAWLPLVALGLSAAVTVLALRPASAWLRLRAMAWQFATGGLVTALVAANALAARLGWGAGAGSAKAGILVGLVIAIVGWPVCWWTFGRFARDDWSPQPRVGAILKLALQAVAGGALAVGITAFASSLGGAAPYALAVSVVGGPLLAWGCARLPAKTPAKAQPDLTRLHRARPLARRAPFALGVVLLAGCLWLAEATDAARETLPGGASADRLVAATDHGLLATTEAGEDGVIVTSAADPAQALRHIVFRPASRSGIQSSTGAAEPFRIAAMALTDGGADGRPKLVASSSTGAVVAVDGALPPKLVVAAARRGALLAAPVLAVNAQGTILAARKFDDRIDITLTDMAAKTAYTLHLPDAPRMTAAAPAGTGCFVWTLANGAVGALRVERRAGVITGIWLPPHPGWRQERLAGGARLIRPMGGTGDTNRFLLVADDGTAAHLTLDCQTGYSTRSVAAMPELKLGDMPPWRDREAVAATSPIVPPNSQEAAPSRRGASAAAKPAPNTTAQSAPVKTAGVCTGPDCGSPPPTRACIERACFDAGKFMARYRAGRGKQVINGTALQALPNLASDIVSRIAARNLTAEGSATSQDADWTIRLSAYLLATIDQETAGQFVPTTELGSDQALATMYGASGARRRSLRNVKEGDASLFRGRGYVQIVGRDNYARVGKLLGIDLEEEPERALEPAIALEIALAVVLDDSFTGRGVTRYITPKTNDYVGARRVVGGGLNNAEKIAERARMFEAALRAALTPNTQ
ncbi:hypothetical protein HNO88_003678 [Novosphingobium chloroacetimidivorans]|uniref:Glycoside hydrolase family 19 catalytic domain-containing protein n=1 Tax=Novosphingobium chloroacetimidivorans TaxID=1428314 RepID=A0A7W7KCJ6_9SPHN|nr:hypothetical protein [Novosphingobium chloroacetimidivorans]MBB4860335.1 hypothetical protein [Novosphingobium chloroacetimidivorans]